MIIEPLRIKTTFLFLSLLIGSLPLFGQNQCLPENVSLECSITHNQTELEAWDANNIATLTACGLQGCETATVTSDFDFNNFVIICSTAGSITVTYTVAGCDQSVDVVASATTDDTVPPQSTCFPIDITIDCTDQNYEAQLASWNDSNIVLLQGCTTDECSPQIEVISNFDITNYSCDGEPLNVTYTITDDCGNFTEFSAAATLEEDEIEQAESIDLSLSIEVSNQAPNIDEVVTFTITVANDGVSEATNVSVSNYLPNGYSNISNISSNGTSQDNTINWASLNIPAQGNIVLTFDAMVLAADMDTNHRNTAQVTSADQNDVDSEPNNDDGDQSEDDEDVLEIILNQDLFSEAFINSAISCMGANDASILATEPTGGTPPYTYQWSSGQSTRVTDFEIAPGSYTVTIQDATGSTFVTDPVRIDDSDAACGGNGGGNDECDVAGGVLKTIETDTMEVTVCVGDNVSDGVYFKAWEAMGEQFRYIVIDADGTILRMNDHIRFEFEHTGTGINNIHHVAWRGDITGFEIGQNINDVQGCFAVSNAIVVTKVDSGEVCDNVDVGGTGCNMTVSVGPDIYICEGEQVDIEALVKKSSVCEIICAEENNNVLVEWGLDACYSVTNNVDNYDFSEFTPDIPDDNCMAIDATIVAVDGGFHSCTFPQEGLSGRAMCISASKRCYWDDESPEAVRFSVTLNPEEYGTITGIQFLEAAPERFQWYNPDFSDHVEEGPNNFPRYYGIRVLKDGQEIFKEIDIPTSNDWTLEEFDFTGMEAFGTNETSTFEFILTGYCPAWRNAISYAWDLDNIKLLGGCCEKDTTITEVSYEWSDGSTEESITVSPTEDTTYSVTVTDCDGCTATDQITVKVQTPLVADLGDDISVCADDLPITISHSADGVESFSWSNGETGSSIDITEAGEYAVTISDGKACEASDVINVTVNSPADINLGNASPICNGESLDLSTLEPSGQTGGVWTNSAGEQVSSVGAGDYTYTYTDSNGCVATASITLTNDDFNFTIENPGAICMDATLDLSSLVSESLSGGTWTNANGETVTSAGEGTYTYTVSNSNGCSASDDITVSVDDFSISLPTPPVLCEGEVYMLSQSEPADYQGGVWMDSQGNVVDEATPGTFKYTVSNDNGCSASAEITFVSSGFTLMQIPDDSLCWGDSLLLSTLEFPDESGGFWKDLNNNVVEYGHPDNFYLYHLFDETNKCAVRVQVKLHEKHCEDPCEGYTVDLATPDVICDDATIDLSSLELDNSSGGTWTNANGDTVETVGGGTYTYTYTNDQGCTASAQLNLNTIVCTDPCEGFTVSVQSPDAICPDETINLSSLENDGSTGGTWTNANGETVETVGAGTYTYNYTNAENCSATATVDVTAKECVDPCEGFSISLNAPDDFCQGETIELSTITPEALAGGTWTDVDDNEITSVTESGNYFFAFTSTDGCTASASINIGFVDCTDPCEGYSISLDAPDDFCQGETIELSTITPDALAGGTWTNADDVEITSVTESGNYFFAFTNGDGCTANASINIGFVDCTDPCDGFTVQVNSPDDGVCPGETFDLTTLEIDGSTGGVWTNAGGDTVSMVGEGNYTYTFTNDQGCSATTDIDVPEAGDCNDPCSDFVLSIDLPDEIVVCEDELPAVVNVPLECATTLEVSSDNGQAIATSEGRIEVTETGIYTFTLTDSEGNRVEDQVHIIIENCNQFDPCDDGDENTENDVQIDDCNCCGAPVLGSVIYVDQDAIGVANGTSWTDAFTDLQEALSIAEAGQDIWIADGTYLPTDDGDTNIAFEVPSGVNLFGGFTGAEGRICERNFNTARTVLSGDLNQDDKVDVINLIPLELLFTGTEENSNRVLVNASMTDDITIDGLAISGGKADNSDLDGGGGFLFASESDATVNLNNVLVIHNQGFGLGGGGRLSTKNGTTMDVNMNRVIFLQNAVQGGGLTKGGGFFAGAPDNGTMNLEVQNSVFAQNYAVHRGGAINTDFVVNQNISNSLFAGNRSERGGATFDNNGSASTTHTNNTFYINFADIAGGAITKFDEFGSHTAEIRNSIFFGNIATMNGLPGFFNFGDANNNFSFTNSLFSEANLGLIDVEAPGSVDGGSNIFATDPMFSDPTNADFSLMSGSVAVNAGNNDFVTIQEDLQGRARIQDDTVDLGANESGDETTCSFGRFDFEQSFAQPLYSEIEFIETEEEVEQAISTTAEILAYPNPTIDEVNLEIEKVNVEDEVSIRLFDPNGKLMPTDIVSINQNGTTVNYTLSVQDLQAGVYFVKTKVGRQTFNKRVIIVK